ncbi:MAG: 30S ribosomal protein S2 [bacterium]
MSDTTLLELLKNGVHFGHQTAKWHPRMKPFIFSSRNGIHIIDLEKTVAMLERAQEFVRGITASGGTILFVGTKRQAKEIVRREAELAGAPFVTERWLGGLFTNFGTVGKVLERLRTLTADRNAGKLEKYVKKERVKFDEEIEKLEKLVGGMREMTALPQAVFLVDIKTEKTALREAKKVDIPVVAMVDTNTDPQGILYPIPANDDATKSIDLITRMIGLAAKEGKEQFAEAQAALRANPPAIAVPPTETEKPNVP